MSHDSQAVPQHRFTVALSKLHLSPDVALALVVALVLASLLVPLPAILVDLGLALNLACSVALLVASLGAREALQVSSFPTALLITTLFRLALNVSSTRLALSEGHAGRVIEAFGEFVVRGDYVVGAVVFSILTLVQFLVVTKGAERVAEVSARFNLDAMPGKQMSIDADLRAGAIDQAQARTRRRALERESQMFGAMDGAMKFVKGDVLAGLVIIFVNLAGGTLIGVLHHGMTASDAASTYALIAIGDGLASQIPSLAVTIAAGLVVTRVAPEEERHSLGSDLGRQFFGRAPVLWVVAGLSAALALLPGMPPLPFLLLAAALGGLGLALHRRAHRREGAGGDLAAGEPGSAREDASPVPAASHAEPGTPLILELAPDLEDLATRDGAAFVRRDLEAMREQLFRALGVRVPGVCVRTGASWLPPGGYTLLLDEVPLGSGQVIDGSVYAACRPEELGYLGLQPEAFFEPGTGAPCARLPQDAAQRLMAAGIEVRSAAEVLCAHLSRLLRRRGTSLLGVQEVRALLDALEPGAPVLVREALQKVPLPLLTDVLRRLVKEEVSIRPLRQVLEALVSPAAEGDAAALAERCRHALGPALTHRHAPRGALYAWLLDPSVEALLREQQRAPLEPDDVARILAGIQQISAGGAGAVLLASPDVRLGMRRLCEAGFPDVAVLSYSELDPMLQVHPLGKLAA